jgi:hypothetical protein
MMGTESDPQRGERLPTEATDFLASYFGLNRK